MDRKLSDYKLQFMELYNNGLSDRAIAKALGFHRTTIGLFRRKLGLQPNIKYIITKEKEDEFRELHEKGLSIAKIAKAMNINYQKAFRYARRKGLDTSKARLNICTYDRAIEKVLIYLKEHGPTSQRILIENLKLRTNHFPRMCRELNNIIERFLFTIGGKGGRGGIKYGSAEIYNGLGIREMGVVLALKNDPRIIDFIAEYIPFKINNFRDARTLVSHLKKQIGLDRARLVVVKLGYHYKTAPLKYLSVLKRPAKEES